MLSVADATQRILDALSPVGSEPVFVGDAAGRVLAEAVAARRSQPPLPVSAMDGYAVRAADVARTPAALDVIGASPAGKPFSGDVAAGQAVRIFTGGAVPDGADAVVIQENTTSDGARVTVLEPIAAGRHIRRAGLDFTEGAILMTPPRELNALDLALIAAANVPQIQVVRRPRVGLLSTGDEIARVGDALGAAQIVGSSAYALAACLEAWGCEAVDLGIAKDDADALRSAAAKAADLDFLVTIGGASVGEHDLVRSALGESGLDLAFWKIAMRPGKPLMFGRLGKTPMLGLPGNPVSALVCAILFLKPAAYRLGGRVWRGHRIASARLGCDLQANDTREDYLRATLTRDTAGAVATPSPIQDSSMLSVLAAAQCLVIRPPQAPAAPAGTEVPILELGSALGR